MSDTPSKLLVTALRADTPIKAIVKSQIYPTELPASALLPAVVYRLVSGIDIARSHTDYGYDRLLWQFDCYGNTHHDAEELAWAVKRAFDARLDGETINITDAAPDPDLKEGDPPLWSSIVEVYTWFKEA